MRLLSVNIGRPERIAAKSGGTGIFKQPVDHPVQITVDGLAGDAICDVKNHGGRDQAVYIYGAGDYAWWSTELNHEFEPGTFGENLTVSDLISTEFNIGDRLHVGETLLEVTAPRIPCVTLATRMGDPTFVKRFRLAERPGLYCRVIYEGSVQRGEGVTIERYQGETISILEMFRTSYEAQLDEATLRRHLAAPIAIRARTAKENQLDELPTQTK